MTELSGWPTESEAAETLTTSVRTINRYAEKGLIEIRKRPRTGRKPENVCNPGDIEKLKPAAHVMPSNGHATVVEEVGEAVQVRPAETNPYAVFAPLVGALIQTISTGFSTIQQRPLWLTMEQAAAYSGIPRSYLTRAVREGRLQAIRSRQRMIRRADLEAFVG